MKAAIFDFDGTLFPYQTLPWLMDFRQRQGYPRLPAVWFRLRILPYYLLYRLRDSEAVKEGFRAYSYRCFNQLFHGMEEDRFLGFLHQAGREIAPLLRPSVVTELERRRAGGYRIVILSGAYTELLRAATEALEPDLVIGSVIRFEAGIYHAGTGLQMIQGKDKVEAIGSYGREGPIDWKASYAYSDSITDIELLERVGNPVMVAPDALLAEAGQAAGWPVIPS